MATIRSQMVLNDGISGVLRKINTALNTTLNAFEQVQRASGRAVDTAQIQAARAALVQANREVDEMAEGYRRVLDHAAARGLALRGPFFEYPLLDELSVRGYENYALLLSVGISGAERASST